MSLPSLRKMNLQSTWTSSQTGPVDLEVHPRDVLHSEMNRYELQYLLYNGCCGNVAKCKDVDTKDVVAVKIFNKSFTGSLKPTRELAMLKRIRGLDPENIVRFIEDFEHKGNTCFAFEMLDKTLHVLLKERRGNRLSLLEIRPIAQQLLTALESLKTAGVIHTNIQPHNIMLTRTKPVKVKLIGFSSAIAAAKVQRGVIMQPVAYRSPDVILGLPISEAVDVWSLGGVLATMYLGSLPFPQRCQYHQVKTMVETLGQPEDTLLSDGAHTRLYFSPEQDSTTPAWRLNTAEEYKAATRFPAQEHRGSSTRFTCLHDLVMLNPEENVVYKMRFVSLLRAMLRLNSQKRITPSVALRHPFVTLTEADGEEVVAPAAAEPSSSDFQEVPAVRSNDASVGAAVSVLTHSGDAPAVDGVNDVSAGDEASESPASERETLPSESVRAVLSPAGGYPDDGASYDRVTDAAAGSAGDTDEAAASPVTTDLYDAVSADKGTVAADGGTVAADEGTVTADGGTVTVDGGTVTAEGGTVTVDGGTVTAEGGTVTADGGTVTADGGTVTADEGTVTADGGTVTADEGTVTANGGTVTADEGTVTADGGTVTADEALTAPIVTESYEDALYSPSDSAYTHVGSDGVSATGSRNRRAIRVRRFFGRMFRALCCCCCCCATNVQQ